MSPKFSLTASPYRTHLMSTNMVPDLRRGSCQVRVSRARSVTVCSYDDTEGLRSGRTTRMLQCPPRQSNLYPTLVLALRDMRQTNGRDPETGTGDGNESWIGLSLAMIVLDTLSGPSVGVGTGGGGFSHITRSRQTTPTLSTRCAARSCMGTGFRTPTRPIGGRSTSPLTGMPVPLTQLQAVVRWSACRSSAGDWSSASPPSRRVTGTPAPSTQKRSTYYPVPVRAGPSAPPQAWRRKRRRAD